MTGPSYFMPNAELSVAVGGCTVCYTYADTFTFVCSLLWLQFPSSHLFLPSIKDLL